MTLTDHEDENLAEEAFLWFLEGEAIGEGRCIEATLPPAQQTITLQVTDSNGSQGEADVSIEVIVVDPNDECPFEDATGLDADENGCIDTVDGLHELIRSYVDSDDINEKLAKSLDAKVKNASKSVSKGNICAAINKLEAFKNQVEAQTGKNKKISPGSGAIIIKYTNNVIADILSQLPQGETC
jgi:hypothetical protein